MSTARLRRQIGRSALLFWLLQYAVDGGTNTLRIAVKQGATLGNDQWHWWDFRPETTNPA